MARPPNLIGGRVVHRVGGRRSGPQPTGPWSRGYDRFPQAIQLPPLSSPKDGPLYRLFGRRALSQSTAYASQEEDTFGQSRPEAATSLGLPPNV